MRKTKNSEAKRMERKLTLSCDYLAGAGAIYRIERRFVKYMGMGHAVSVCNATQAIMAILKAFDIQESEIITTPYTWGGSVAGAIALKNRLVFADINPVTLTLDSESVEKKITNKTKAIIAVDIYGNPCFAKELRDIANRRGIKLIQDCAQSFGALYDNKPSGNLADAVVFSLSHQKGLSKGEGGMICTSDSELYRKLIWLTQHPNRQKRDVPGMPLNEFGLNLRMSPQSAGEAIRNFDRALLKIREHQKAFTKLEMNIHKKFGIKSSLIQGYTSSYYRFTIDMEGLNIEGMKKFLAKRSINTILVTPPITQALYQNPAYGMMSAYYSTDRCPVAERQCETRLRITSSNRVSIY